MTRDENLIHIYGQRGKVLAWVRRQGVPTADAEILVEKAIENVIQRIVRGKYEKSLAFYVGREVARYFKFRSGKVVPVGDMEVFEKMVYLRRTTGKKESHAPAE